MKVRAFIYKENENINIDIKPNLVFMFFENKNLRLVEECYGKLKNLNFNIEVVGVNGKGGNLNNNIPFITKINQISLLLFEIDDFSISIYNVENIKKTREYFMQDYEKCNNSASIIFFPFKYDTNRFLDYIQDKQNMHNIYGGVYADDKNGCFYNGEFFDNRLISVFFNQEKIEFFSIALHGWKPVGISFKVTKSKQNIVYEIENELALKVIEDYIGKIKRENIDKFLHPFCVKHKDNISLASIKSIDRKNNAIEFYKYIYEGENIQVTIPINQKQMMELIEKVLEDIKCDGLFMFSCIGRYAYYNDLIEFEIQKVADYLKVPFAGFLTYGEIGSNSINTRSILQNQTMNLIFFKEK